MQIFIIAHKRCLILFALLPPKAVQSHKPSGVHIVKNVGLTFWAESISFKDITVWLLNDLVSLESGYFSISCLKKQTKKQYNGVKRSFKSWIATC